MVVDPIQLLRKLEPPVRPAGAPGSGVAGRPPLESQSFDQLLSIVSTGSIRSGRAVTVDASASIAPLEPSQLERLADAADAAEASGSQRAVMLMDGRGLVLDIGSRTVTSELSSAVPGARPEPVLGIDAAVYVEGGETDPGHETRTEAA